MVVSRAQGSRQAAMLKLARFTDVITLLSLKKGLN